MANYSNDSLRLGEEVTIYHEEGRDCVTADLLKLNNGALAVVFRNGSDHKSMDGDIKLTLSTDEGRTWSPPRTIKAGIHPPFGFRSPSLCELRDGTLILSFFRFSGHYGRSWDGTHLVVMRSFDGGQTWPDEQELSAPFDFMLTNEHGFELPSGRVLMPVYGGSQQHQFTVSGVMCSDNKGADWRYLSTIDTRPFYKDSRFYMENAIVRTASGRLVAVSRTSRHMIQAISEDEGRSWKRHRALKDTPPSTQPSLCRLSDGTLLLSYGDRGALPHDLSYPFNIRIRTSKDEGETWEEGFILRDRLPHWDMGYPTTVELRPGRMFTLYWRSEPAEGREWPNGWKYWLSGRSWGWQP